MAALTQAGVDIDVVLEAFQHVEYIQEQWLASGYAGTDTWLVAGTFENYGEEWLYNEESAGLKNQRGEVVSQGNREDSGHSDGGSTGGLPDTGDIQDPPPSEEGSYYRGLEQREDGTMRILTPSESKRKYGDGDDGDDAPEDPDGGPDNIIFNSPWLWFFRLPNHDPKYILPAYQQHQSTLIFGSVVRTAYGFA